MAKTDQPTTIKKYANRRLYNTGTSTYVTLEDLASMVKDGEDFLVFDAKTGDDITRQVLAQIIFEQENKAGQNLLPTTFLRQLIRFMQLFEQTFSMFKPFVPARGGNSQAVAPEPEKIPEPASEGGDIDELRRQMKDMQERLERMSHEPKKHD